MGLLFLKDIIFMMPLLLNSLCLFLKSTKRQGDIIDGWGMEAGLKPLSFLESLLLPSASAYPTPEK